MGSLCDVERSKYRVKENHPAHEAILDLFEYLEKNDIQVVQAKYVNQIFDIIYKGHRYALHDLEEGPVAALPPVSEYVIGTDEIPPKDCHEEKKP
jgi:hypothetical protein